MSYVYRFMEWLEGIIFAGADVCSWLLTDLNLGIVTLTPLELLSLGGLTTFVVIAIAKWVIT